MDEPVDHRIKAAALEFLQGMTSVLEFRSEFTTAVWLIAEARPLHGVEIELFDVLEQWEATIFPDRPAVVDRMRRIAEAAVATG
ncbi:hypothetical protein [Nocardia colli]|uniref:hypothetical protein n=1 Tax=Nocardia colli TaxID=2545717 RepID=UPI0035E1F29D